MKKIELLAPAGNMESLKAAIKAGCDAVYLGGKLFGARSFAGNFSLTELKDAIELSHECGVKVYLTINTTIYEREVEEFLNYVRYAHKCNVDAVIIQDLGMFDLLRKKFPNLELHASTQMHIHNYEGAKLAKELGIKRIVVARETSLEVIEKIKKEIDIEVEVFIHGALCVSYSGQCLMSALIGNRSGNRGTCAQVCRKKYSLLDKNFNKLNEHDYLLSTKDLYTLPYIDKIINSGADSLKIEGRMKRAEYVYQVVKLYREVIDNFYKTGKIKIDEKKVKILKMIFNRKFTKGFILNENNNSFTNEIRPNHEGIEIGRVKSYKNGYLNIELKDILSLKDGLRIISKEDYGLVVNKMFINKKEVKDAFKGDTVSIKYDKEIKEGSVVLKTTDYNSINEIDNILKKDIKIVNVSMKLEAYLNKTLKLTLCDGKNTVNIESDFLVEESKNYPIDKNTIIKQLSKTGKSVYVVNDIEILMDDNIFINIKDLNNVRREAFERLSNLRKYKIDFIENNYDISVKDFTETKNYVIDIDKKKQFIKDKCNYAYTENKSLLSENIFLKIPRVVKNYNEYEKSNNIVLIGELGAIKKYDKFITDFSFNVTNSYSVAFLHSLGAQKVTLSPELTLSNMKLLIDNYKKRYNKKPNLEVITNGFLEAMICKYNLCKKYNITEGYLRDEFQNLYKIKNFENYMKVYNYKKIEKINAKDYFDIGINSVRNLNN